MTDAKHTPGPWEFGYGYTPGASSFDLYGPGGREVIASASYENMWLSAYDADTNAANARLIASAPDFFAACVPSDLEDAADIVGAENSFLASELRKQATAQRAAIARATGEAA